jgi:hypothetical protein
VAQLAVAHYPALDRPLLSENRTAAQLIHRNGDPFELGCKVPCFIGRKYGVRAVEIDMHLAIKSKDRPSSDKCDARLASGRDEISFRDFLGLRKDEKFGVHV